MASFELMIVPDTEEIPEDPACSPCAVKRRRVPWPYVAKEGLTITSYEVPAEITDPVTVWLPATGYFVGDYIQPTDPANAPYVYRAVRAGGTGDSEPTWPLGVGGQVTEDANFSLFGFSKVVWANVAAMDVEYTATLRINQTVNDPPPTDVYSYEMFLKVVEGGPNCPALTTLVLKGSERFGINRPAFVSASAASSEMTFLTDIGISQPFGQSFLGNPADYLFVFDGLVSTYYPSNQPYSSYFYIANTGNYYSALFLYPRDFDGTNPPNDLDSYMYMDMPKSLTGSFTLAVQHLGVEIASITFNFTLPELPTSSNGIVPVIELTNITGDFFGQISPLTHHIYTCSCASPVDTFLTFTVDALRPDAVFSPLTTYQIPITHQESYFNNPHPGWLLDPSSVTVIFIIDGVEAPSNIYSARFNTPGDNTTWTETIWQLDTGDPLVGAIFFIQATEGANNGFHPGYVNAFNYPEDIHDFGIKIVGGGVDSQVKYNITRVAPGPTGLRIVMTEAYGPLFGAFTHPDVYSYECF